MAETLVKKEYVIKERNAANLDTNSKAVDLFDATDYKTTLTTSYQNFAVKGADEKVLVIVHNITSGGGAADATVTVKKQGVCPADLAVVVQTADYAGFVLDSAFYARKPADDPTAGRIIEMKASAGSALDVYIVRLP